MRIIKYTQHQLTDSSTHHFLCRNRKDRQNLNKNVNDYVAHSHSRCDASIYLQPEEEILNAVKDVNKLVLVSACIVSRLGSESKQVAQGRDVGY